MYVGPFVIFHGISAFSLGNSRGCLAGDRPGEEQEFEFLTLSSFRFLSLAAGGRERTAQPACSNHTLSSSVRWLRSDCRGSLLANLVIQ